MKTIVLLIMVLFNPGQFVGGYEVWVDMDSCMKRKAVLRATYDDKSAFGCVEIPVDKFENPKGKKDIHILDRLDPL